MPINSFNICFSYFVSISLFPAVPRYLQTEGLSPDPFLGAVFEELSQLEEPRPGAVARILQPLLQAHPVPPLAPMQDPEAVRMCTAEILEPQQDGDTVYKLTSGLVVRGFFSFNR